MKKLMCVCMILMCVFLNVAEARADIIVMPESSFLRRHELECEYLERTFIANGPDGEVIVYKSPISSKKMGKIENGKEIWSAWAYEDTHGIKWAYYSDDYRGWIPMEYLQPVYDYVAFERDFGDKFVSEHGQIGAEYANATIHTWACPGGKEKEQIYLSEDYRPEYDITYKDEEGRTWAYCVYYMGFQNFWMCLDELGASFEELYPNGSNIPIVEDVASEFPANGEQIVPKLSNSMWTIGVGIAGVVIVTVIVLVIMKKKIQCKGR